VLDLPTNTIVTGSSTVLIGGPPAARKAELIQSSSMLLYAPKNAAGPHDLRGCIIHLPGNRANASLHYR
jgi:hypothetical protein